MANEEHVALLNQGTTAWNQWRKSNTHIIPDLSRANLHNIDLSLFDLHGVDLSHANLSSAYLNQTNLIKANLQGANLLQANLSGANLQDANLNYLILRQTEIDDKTIIDPKTLLVWEIINQGGASRKLKGVDLRQTNLFAADLNSSDLSHANLSQANLTNANLSDAYFYQANLEQANLTNANLNNAYFSHANLTKVNLWGASIKGTYFRDTDLQFAHWHQAQIDRKTIIDSKWYLVWTIVNQGVIQHNLSETDLSNANLRASNFSEANLSAADLSNSDLRGCDLTQANLSKANLRGANLCGANLNQANLDGVKLQKAIGDRHTQFPTNFKFAKAGMVMRSLPPTTEKEKVTKIQTVAQPEPPKKQETKRINWLILTGIIISLLAASSYCFWEWQYNPNSRLRPMLQKFIPLLDIIQPTGENKIKPTIDN
jgi:uncharacterized protein YjbI with pentapeptide repeats